MIGLTHDQLTVQGQPSALREIATQTSAFDLYTMGTDVFDFDRCCGLVPSLDDQMPAGDFAELQRDHAMALRIPSDGEGQGDQVLRMGPAIGAFEFDAQGHGFGAGHGRGGVASQGRFLHRHTGTEWVERTQDARCLSGGVAGSAPQGQFKVTHAAMPDMGQDLMVSHVPGAIG